MTCYHPKPAIPSYVKAIDEKSGEIKLQKKMKFLNPLREDIDELKDNIVMIPCGKCVGCRLDKANDWATRCYAEAKHWKNNCFITLTYDNKNLPHKRSLCKKDLQDFWKRLRKKHKGFEKRIYKNKEEYPIRYFCCGEYGPKTLRPHYHAGIFNWRPTDLKPYKKNIVEDQLFTSEELRKIWKKGFIVVGDLTYESACYIARYVMKKAYGADNKFFIKHNREPEFVETSRNGGIGYMLMNEENFKKIKRNLGIFVKPKGQTEAKLKKLPNFIRKKWREIDALEYYIAMDNRAEQLKKETIKKMKETDLNPEQYRMNQKEQLLQRIRLLKRNDL